MEPMNLLTVIMFFGVELVLLGIIDDSPIKKLIGSIIMMVGWVVNILAICKVF